MRSERTELVLDGDDFGAMEALVRRFAREIEAALFTGEAADGNLDRLPALLAQAQSLDLLADPAPGAPGNDLGVWGRHCLDEGVLLSLHSLSLLAETCAGFAAAVHAQGLGCLALGDAPHTLPPGTCLAAAYLPAHGLPAGPRAAGSGLTFRDETGTARLNGTAHFVLSAGEPAALVCFATTASDPLVVRASARPGGAEAPTTNGEWVVVLLDANTLGVMLASPGRRTGLRAAHQFHLTCDAVDVPLERIVARGAAARRVLALVLACDWLGQAAIALGTVRRALVDARAYARDRYQGGDLIGAHPAVQLLLGTAEADRAVIEAIVHRHAQEPLAGMDGAGLLRWAAAARLTAGEHAHRAVTNCLQVLGGYGYMEDYCMEKRLRDVTTLKSLHGAPDQLRLLLDGLKARQP